jgi:hypothetical protein
VKGEGWRGFSEDRVKDVWWWMGGVVGWLQLMEH